LRKNIQNIKYTYELSENEREKIWDDHLHLNANGYKLMAHNIFKTIFPFLQSIKLHKFIMH